MKTCQRSIPTEVLAVAVLLASTLATVAYASTSADSLSNAIGAALSSSPEALPAVSHQAPLPSPVVHEPVVLPPETTHKSQLNQTATNIHTAPPPVEVTPVAASMAPIYREILQSKITSGGNPAHDDHPTTNPQHPRATTPPPAAAAPGGISTQFSAPAKIPYQVPNPSVSVASNTNTNHLSTLHDLLEAAVANNENVRLAEESLRDARANRLAAVGAFFPHLSFQEQAQLYQNVSGVPSSTLVGSNIVLTQGSIYSNYMSLVASLNLFEGGSGVENVLAARKGVASAHAEILNRQNRALLDVLIAYENLLELKTESQITERALALARQSISLTQDRLARGDASLLQLNERKSQMQSFQVNENSLHKKLLDAQTSLALLLGTPHAFSLVDSLTSNEPIPEPPAALVTGSGSVKTSFQDTPAVIAARDAVQQAEHQVSAIRGSFFPKVDLQASYNWLGSAAGGFGDALNSVNRNNYTVGISITQTLAPFTGHLAKLRSAEAQLESARIRYQQSILEARGKLRSAQDELQSGHQKMLALEASYDEAKENAHLVAALFAQGRVDQVAKEQAMLHAQRAKQSYENSRMQWLIAQWMYFALTSPSNLETTLLRATYQ